MAKQTSSLARTIIVNITTTLLGVCVPFMGCPLQGYVWLYTLLCTVPSCECSHGMYNFLRSVCPFHEYLPLYATFFHVFVCISPPCVFSLYVDIFFAYNSSLCITPFSIYLSLFVIGRVLPFVILPVNLSSYYLPSVYTSLLCI